MRTTSGLTAAQRAIAVATATGLYAVVLFGWHSYQFEWHDVRSHTRDAAIVATWASLPQVKDALVSGRHGAFAVLYPAVVYKAMDVVGMPIDDTTAHAPVALFAFVTLAMTALLLRAWGVPPLAMCLAVAAVASSPGFVSYARSFPGSTMFALGGLVATLWLIERYRQRRRNPLVVYVAAALYLTNDNAFFLGIFGWLPLAQWAATERDIRFERIKDALRKWFLSPGFVILPLVVAGYALVSWRQVSQYGWSSAGFLLRTMSKSDAGASLDATRYLQTIILVVGPLLVLGAAAAAIWCLRASTQRARCAVLLAISAGYVLPIASTRVDFNYALLAIVPLSALIAFLPSVTAQALQGLAVLGGIGASAFVVLPAPGSLEPRTPVRNYGSIRPLYGIYEVVTPVLAGEGPFGRVEHAIATTKNVSDMYFDLEGGALDWPFHYKVPILDLPKEDALDGRAVDVALSQFADRAFAIAVFRSDFPQADFSGVLERLNRDQRVSRAVAVESDTGIEAALYISPPRPEWSDVRWLGSRSQEYWRRFPVCCKAVPPRSWEPIGRSSGGGRPTPDLSR